VAEPGRWLAVRRASAVCQLVVALAVPASEPGGGLGVHAGCAEGGLVSAFPAVLLRRRVPTAAWLLAVGRPSSITLGACYLPSSGSLGAVGRLLGFGLDPCSCSGGAPDSARRWPLFPSVPGCAGGIWRSAPVASAAVVRVTGAGLLVARLTCAVAGSAGGSGLCWVAARTLSGDSLEATKLGWRGLDSATCSLSAI
jgi:hypothetical protein